MNVDDNTWIEVPNWRRFQRYQNRTPPWIKLYLELNQKQEWLDLTDAERGLLVRIWLLYAATHGQLRVGAVHKQAWTKHTAGHLASLNHAGLIRLSAHPLHAQKRSTSYFSKERASAAPADAGASTPEKTTPPNLEQLAEGSIAAPLLEAVMRNQERLQ